MQLIRDVSQQLAQAVVDNDYNAFKAPINAAPNNRLRQHYCDIEGRSGDLLRLTGKARINDFAYTPERFTMQKLVHACLHADRIQNDLMRAFDIGDFDAFKAIIDDLPDERTRQMFCHFEAGILWQPSPLAQIEDEEARTSERMRIFDHIQLYIAEGRQEYHSRRGLHHSDSFPPRGRAKLHLVNSP